MQTDRVQIWTYSFSFIARKLCETLIDWKLGVIHICLRAVCTSHIEKPVWKQIQVIRLWFYERLQAGFPILQLTRRRNRRYAVFQLDDTLWQRLCFSLTFGQRSYVMLAKNHFLSSPSWTTENRFGRPVGADIIHCASEKMYPSNSAVMEVFDMLSHIEKKNRCINHSKLEREHWSNYSSANPWLPSLPRGHNVK